jgi:membrane protease YdiL (CAAX protease family)
LHWWPAMVPEFLFLGIVLAVVFERTRSLYPSMVMHAAYNAAIILMTLHVV